MRDVIRTRLIFSRMIALLTSVAKISMRISLSVFYYILFSDSLQVLQAPGVVHKIILRSTSVVLQPMVRKRKSTQTFYKEQPGPRAQRHLGAQGKICPWKTHVFIFQCCSMLRSFRGHTLSVNSGAPGTANPAFWQGF